MFKKLKRNWRLLKQSRPGHRFVERYERRRQQSKGRFDGWRWFNIAAGTAITAAGIFLLPAPGPGAPVIFLGLGLVAGEFLAVARFLDWAEIKIRKIVKRGKRLWKSRTA